MVRHLLQGRVIRRLLAPLRIWFGAVSRWLLRVVRWLYTWLAHYLRSLQTRWVVAMRLLGMMVRPADPNNLFTTASASLHVTNPQRTVDLEQLPTGERRSTLVYAAEPQADPLQAEASGAGPAGRVPTLAISLRGAVNLDDKRIQKGITAVNRRFSYQDLLGAELKRLKPPAVAELSVVISRLARRWLALDEEFIELEKRGRLDLSRTLRHNLSRYGGHVLDFKWDTRQLPVAKYRKPARLLVIGDVSRSMYRYVTISLYFFHLLNFVFHVDSWVFSERATRSTPYLNGPDTFEQKVQRLVKGAASWNAGTRFGSSLRQIVAEANIDPHTYAVIVTDGKVTLKDGEYEAIQRWMGWLRRRARQVVFFTPEVDLAGAHGTRPNVQPVGTFRSGMVELPIFNLDTVWNSMLTRYADRVYHVRTVQDLVDACDHLYQSTKG